MIRGFGSINKLRFVALFPLAIVYVIGLSLLAHFRSIRIWELRSDRIGHFIEDHFEHQHLQNSLDTALDLTYFSTKRVCNDYFASLVKRDSLVVPGLRETISLSQKVPILGNLLTSKTVIRKSSEYESRFLAYLPLEKRSKRFEFTESEFELGNSWLNSHGELFQRPFVCILIRDNAYLNSELPAYVWTYHSYRNSDIEDYVESVKLLIDKGFSVIRMGKLQEKPFPYKSPYFLDYAFSENKSDFMDIFLFSSSNGIISTLAGIDCIGRIMNTPTLYVNCLPLADSPFYSNSLIAPKILRRVNDDTPLSIDQHWGHRYYSAENYREQGLNIGSLPSNVIREVTSEWIDFLSEEETQVENWEGRKALKGLTSKYRSEEYLHPKSRISEVWLDYLEGRFVK